MTDKRTIAALAARRDELVAELSELRAEIAARAGEVDPPQHRSPAHPAARAVAHKAAPHKAVSK